MRSKFSTLVLTVIFLLGIGSNGFAQLASQGTIRGIVEDETGARLPGVTVTATSPALVGERIYVTGESGIFRLDALIPGVYELTLELEGFSTIKRGGIIVSSKKVVSLSFVMKIAAVEEVLTVTAESPTVDTKTTTTKFDFTADFLNQIPEPRGTGSDILSMTPGGYGSSHAGGGSSSVSWQIDGVDTSDPAMGTQFPFVNIDYVQETEVITWGAQPEYGKFSGALFNIVTKSGSTEYHGEANFFYRHESFFHENHQKVQEQFPTFSITPFELKKYYDYSANIGGPIKKNKVHFFVSWYQLFDDRIPAGNVEVRTNHSKRTVNKLTFQLGDKDRVTGALMFDEYPITGRAPAGTLDPNAYNEEPSWTFNPIASWQHVFNQETLLEVRFMGYYGFYNLEPRNTLPCIFELTTYEISQSYYGYYHNGRGSSEIHADLSYFADQWHGTHDFKVGVHFQDAYVHDIRYWGTTEFGEGIFYYAWEGVIIEAMQREPFDITHHYQPLTFYVQDSWVIKDRFTLNGGVRIDKTKGMKKGGAPWINYTDIAPRIGGAYELTADGKTVVRASYGRYYEAPHCRTFSVKDWPATYYYDVYGPGDWSLYRIRDSASDVNLDPNLKNHFADMFSVGLEREIMPDWSFRIQYNHREDKQVFGGKDTKALWEPFTATDPVTNRTFTMYQQTNVGENEQWMINNDKLHLKYNGVDLLLTKRYSNNWQMIASFTWNVAKGNYSPDYSSGGNATGSINLGDDDNDFVNAEGKASRSYPIIFKLGGSYRFPSPWDFSVGWTYLYMSGLYDHRTLTVRAPNGRRYTVIAEERGNYQHEARSILDIRLEKKLKLPGSIGGINPAGEIGIMLDVFNLFNEDTITSRRMTTGSLYLTPRSIIEPRGIRLGFRWLF